MVTSVSQLALFFLAVGAGIGNQLFACATKAGDSETPSFSQSRSEGAVTIRSHSHDSKSRLESTIHALQQKMRSEDKCGGVDYQDEFDKYTPYSMSTESSNLRTSPSMLQAGFSAVTTQLPHIAATGNYDPEHEIVHVGVNVQGPLGDCVNSACFTIVWCSCGSFLRVRGFSYRVTSIMLKGQSMCMYDKCKMSQVIDDMVRNAVQQPQLARDERTFTVQLEDIPNAPFRITVEGVTHKVTGELQAQVSFSNGNMGMMMPGWICIKCCDGVPLQLLVAMMPIGCIHRIEKSDGTVQVQRYPPQKVDPTFRAVELGGRVYFLPNTIPDQTHCLAKDVRDLLMGGDAVVDTCPSLRY